MTIDNFWYPAEIEKFAYFFAVPNLEEEVAKMPDKEGWIRLAEYMKFALGTELCKIEFQDRVFSKVDYGAEDEKKKNEGKKESKAKVHKYVNSFLQGDVQKPLKKNAGRPFASLLTLLLVVSFVMSDAQFV